MIQLEADTIGSLAAEPLEEKQGALVIGNNSKGIYLQTTSEWLLYLSFERFRGPLTINVRSNKACAFSNFQLGQTAYLSKDWIRFPALTLKISLQCSLVWHPQPVLKTRTTPPENFKIAMQMLNSCQHASLEKTTQGIQHSISNNARLEVQDALARQDVGSLEVALNALLGCGVGLTPCGDDFVIGLCLRLNRWKEDWLGGVELERFNRSLVQAAFNRTSLLSAHLIKCATLGLADERLINALDWLMGGEEEEDLKVIEYLLGWGHSSGAAVLESYLING